jgi:hypothetical protein
MQELYEARRTESCDCKVLKMSCKNNELTNVLYNDAFVKEFNTRASPNFAHGDETFYELDSILPETCDLHAKRGSDILRWRKGEPEYFSPKLDREATCLGKEP